MNRQPYCKPPRWWAPKLSPWWVRVSRRYRRRQLERQQRIAAVDLQCAEILREAVAGNQGVLITPNHAAHYDAPALYLAADSIDQPLYFMTAWQVFAMSSRLEQWAMQRLGCFSVDREGTDRQAFKRAVSTLQREPHPLVIFPEGDIFHTTDVVTHFREGAAAIALSAAKRTDRPVVAIPCGIKFWYIEDPLFELQDALQSLERRLYLRTVATMQLADRIHRLAEAALALKELDYLGHTRSGRLRDRVRHLEESVLQLLEQRHAEGRCQGTTPERVKTLRQQVIRKLEEQERLRAPRSAATEGLTEDMEDLFFVMQLYSYHGDYLADSPTIERLAETVDKFEEDILGFDYPKVRGRRRVVVRFGDPVPVGRGGCRDTIVELTKRLQARVQQLLDELNAQSPNRDRFDRMRP